MARTYEEANFVFHEAERKIERAMRAKTIYACSRCGMYRDVEEIVCNYGWCDECLEERCPCQEGNPGACPLHPWPDVVLSLDDAFWRSLRTRFPESPGIRGGVPE